MESASNCFSTVHQGTGLRAGFVITRVCRAGRCAPQLMEAMNFVAPSLPSSKYGSWERMINEPIEHSRKALRRGALQHGAGVQKLQRSIQEGDGPVERLA